VDDFKAEPETINDNSIKQQTLLASAWKDYFQPQKYWPVLQISGHKLQI